MPTLNVFSSDLFCKRQRIHRRYIEKWLRAETPCGAGAWASGQAQSFGSHSPGGWIVQPRAWGAEQVARRWQGWRGCEVAGQGAAESARRRCTGAGFCSPCVLAPPTRWSWAWASARAWAPAWARAPAPTVRLPGFQSLRFPTCYTGWATRSHCYSCPTRPGSLSSVLGSCTPLERVWRTVRSPAPTRGGVSEKKRQRLEMFP